MSKVTIVANNVQLLGGKSDGGPVQSGAPKFQPNNNASSSDFSGGYSQDSFGGTGSDFPEDIPF